MNPQVTIRALKSKLLLRLLPLLMGMLLISLQAQEGTTDPTIFGEIARFPPIRYGILLNNWGVFHAGIGLTTTRFLQSKRLMRIIGKEPMSPGKTILTVFAISMVWEAWEFYDDGDEYSKIYDESPQQAIWDNVGDVALAVGFAALGMRWEKPQYAPSIAFRYNEIQLVWNI